MPGKHYKKYSYGGPILGPSHEEGGVMIPVKNGKHPIIEAEGGEFIVSKDAMEKHGDKIVALNEDGNDAPLLEGYYQSGGPLIQQENIVDVPPEVLSNDSATWIRDAVQKYIPSDDPNDTEALINFGEAILPTRLPTMDDFRAIWNSDNPAQELFNFSLMLGLTKKFPKKKPKGKATGYDTDITPEKIQRDVKHQVKKADNARKAGIVPILKGGREGKGLDETKARTKTSLGGEREKYDLQGQSYAEWQFNQKQWGLSGDGFIINSPGSTFNGWSAQRLNNGNYKFFDRNGKEVKNPLSMDEIDKLDLKGQRSMDSHNYADIKELLRKEGIPDDDIVYRIRVDKPDKTGKEMKMVNEEVFNAYTESKIIESSIVARHGPEAMKKPGIIPAVGQKFKMMPREKGGLHENGGRVYEIMVDGKPVYVQSNRIAGISGGSKRGWFIVDEKELANPGAPRVNDVNSPKYLGVNKKEVRRTLQSGENPQQRHNRKVQQNIEQQPKEVKTEFSESSDDLMQYKTEDRGDPARLLARLQKEKKAEAQSLAKWNKKYSKAKQSGKVPQNMTRKEWIETQQYVEISKQKMKDQGE